MGKTAFENKDGPSCSFWELTFGSKRRKIKREFLGEDCYTFSTPLILPKTV